MQLGLVVAVALVSVLAGLGGGLALADHGVVPVPEAVVREVVAEAPAEEAAEARVESKRRIGVAAYIDEGEEVTAQTRALIARHVDGHFVANGWEVFVSVKGLSNQTLWIETEREPTRVESYRAAQELHFDQLQSTGFATLIVGNASAAWGFDIAVGAAEQTLLGPVRMVPPK